MINRLNTPCDNTSKYRLLFSLALLFVSKYYPVHRFSSLFCCCGKCKPTFFIMKKNICIFVFHCLNGFKQLFENLQGKVV